MAGTVGGSDLEDLIHLTGPLTEDAVLRALQARFAATNYFVSTFTPSDFVF
jgi:dachs protein